MVMNDNGRVVDQRTFGADGQLTIPLDEDCAVNQFTFDDHGNKIEFRCLGSDEKPKETKAGIATARFTYNENGKITHTVALDSKGNVLLDEDESPSPQSAPQASNDETPE